MQEDIENKTVSMAVSGSKFTGRMLKDAITKLLAHQKNPKAAKDVTPHGKQTVKQLIQKDQGVTSVELNDPHIRDFERVARKYGVDYAIKRVKGEPNKYLIFFKGRDEDAITAAMTEYADKRLRREERPSVLKLLKKLKELVASRNPVKNKEKERSR